RLYTLRGQALGDRLRQASPTLWELGQLLDDDRYRELAWACSRSIGRGWRARSPASLQSERVAALYAQRVRLHRLLAEHRHADLEKGRITLQVPARRRVDAYRLHTVLAEHL